MIIRALFAIYSWIIGVAAITRPLRSVLTKSWKGIGLFCLVAIPTQALYKEVPTSLSREAAFFFFTTSNVLLLIVGPRMGAMANNRRGLARYLADSFSVTALLSAAIAAVAMLPISGGVVITVVLLITRRLADSPNTNPTKLGLFAHLDRKEYRIIMMLIPVFWQFADAVSAVIADLLNLSGIGVLSAVVLIMGGAEIVKEVMRRSPGTVKHASMLHGEGILKVIEAAVIPIQVASNRNEVSASSGRARYGGRLFILLMSGWISTLGLISVRGFLAYRIINNLGITKTMYVVPATVSQIVIGSIVVWLSAAKSESDEIKKGMLEPVAALFMGIAFSLITLLWWRIDSVNTVTLILIRGLDGLLNYGIIEMSWALRSSTLSASKFAKLNVIDNSINVIANVMAIVLATIWSDTIACGIIGAIMLLLYIVLCLCWFIPAGRKKIIQTERRMT